LSAADNRRIIEEAFAGTANGDGSKFLGMMADDVVWTTIGTTSWSRTFKGKTSVIMDNFRPLLQHFDGPNIVTAHRFVAEGDVVVAEGHNHSRTKAGEAYNNCYSWTFVFRDGRVVEITEYCDTALIERVLPPLQS
jgi:uncharacterized protein